jgi:hypothetical protein
MMGTLHGNILNLGGLRLRGKKKKEADLGRAAKQ